MKIASAFAKNNIGQKSMVLFYVRGHSCVFMFTVKCFLDSKNSFKLYGVLFNIIERRERFVYVKLLMLQRGRCCLKFWNFYIASYFMVHFCFRNEGVLEMTME
ncbi:hypothetical protein EGW08_021073 [Elysia chlorotica]|uniref:Uncharacterized protein n=1 Tax=Elysia chlorotica TaxID=188477 RepID=A0A433SPI7_ELYCH|nr:hypothetical protein EGW08_021073 [Elysia chlorotica]